jgi:DUF4097 and DUF4098 domain-containing protein YvlB
MEFEIRGRKGGWLVPVGLGFIALGVVVLLVGVLLGGRGGDLRWENGRLVFAGMRSARNTEVHELTGDIHNIYVDMTAARITVRATNGPAELHLRDVEADWSLEDGVLSVTREAREGRNFTIVNMGWHNNNPRVYIYLPASTLENIDLRATSGSVRTYDIEAYNMTLNVVSGSIRVTGGAAHTANINATSGSVRGESFNWQTLVAGATSGSVRFEGAQPAAGGFTDLSATSGSVRLYVAMHPRYFNYEVSSRSGTARAQGQRASGTNNRITGTGSEAEHHIEIHTGSGSARLEFN